ncbi:MAG: Hsp20/alpha crystallin family protein [Pirellulaceae bacterium]|nr:Hsp20/alpha crystallin family protein [Pirellulaceae bacterium]
MVRTLIPISPRFTNKIGNLNEEMEQLLHFALRGESGATAWTPRMNVAETETEYSVSLELPGIPPEDVRVEIEDGHLLISGKVEEETKDEGKYFHRMERRTGEFRRVFALPDEVDAEKIDAHFEHGILRVSLPKAEKARPQRITVKIK